MGMLPNLWDASPANSFCHPKNIVAKKTRFGCFCVTAILRWGWVEVDIETEVDLRLKLKWGWDKVESKFNWNWVEVELSWGWEISWYWINEEIGLS